MKVIFQWSRAHSNKYLRFYYSRVSLINITISITCIIAPKSCNYLVFQSLDFDRT
jgi:hypothetical protein